MFLGGSNSTGKIQSNIVQGGPERGFVIDSSLFGQVPNTALTMTSNIAESFAGNGFEANTNSLTNSKVFANIGQVAGSSGLLLQTGNTGNNFLANIFRGAT